MRQTRRTILSLAALAALAWSPLGLVSAESNRQEPMESSPSLQRQEGLRAALAHLEDGPVGQGSDPETALKSIGDLEIGRLRGPTLAGKEFRVRLTIGGVTMSLDLAPFSVRAPDFRVELREEGGRVKLLDPGPVRTVRGTIREIAGSLVTGIVLDRGLEAMIQLPDETVLWLEPAAKYQKGLRRDLYALSPCGLDEGEGHGATCALVSAPALEKKLQPLFAASTGENCAALGGCVADILCDTDSAFYIGNNSSAAQAQSTVEGLMALVIPRFQQPFNITHRISQIVIRPVAAQDPYADPSITSAGELLTRISEQWPQGNQDLVHLFTGRRFGNFAGAAASIGGVCGYGYHGMYSYSSGVGGGCPRAGIVAHELGHSWGAEHTTGIMQAGADCNAPWADISLTQISVRRDQVDGICLDLQQPRDAKVLSQSVPTAMAAGRVYPVSITLQNTGTETWSPIGPQCNAYRLGMANPYNNGTWLPATRVELLAPVAPGGQVTLNFNVAAPLTPGTYNFQMQMVQECVTWFGDFTPNVVVTVQAAPARDAQILSQSVPSTMTAGQSYPVSIRVRNIGTLTWSPIGPQCNAYRLGSANPYNNGTWVPATRVELPATIAQGGEVTLNFNVTAPTTPGIYNFQMQMVQECVVWFGDFSPNVAVSVN